MGLLGCAKTKRHYCHITTTVGRRREGEEGRQRRNDGGGVTEEGRGSRGDGGGATEEGGANSYLTLLLDSYHGHKYIIDCIVHLVCRLIQDIIFNLPARDLFKNIFSTL